MMQSETIAQPARRTLLNSQRQAYEGAHSFYTCFLPLTIVSTHAAIFYYSPFAPTNILFFLFHLLTYLVALNFYRLCNSINVDVFAHGNYQHPKETQIQKQLERHPQPQDCSGAHGSSTLIEQSMKYQLDNSVSSSVLIASVEKPEKFYCKKCKVLCPYRTRHCPKCQICVFRYDHHCFWIGNCVGYANHKQFYLFLLCQTFNNILNLLALGNLNENVKGFGLWIWIGVLTLRLLAFGFVCFTGYLLLYHSLLMLSGMTTWQHMSRRKITYLNYLPAGYNPFSQGVVNNVKQFWRRRPISQVNYEIPKYEEVGGLEVGFNIIQNKYYSCC